METKTDLYKSIAAVMCAVRHIGKNLTVGTGRNSYKGVSDEDVKTAIGEEMVKNSLIILTKSIKPTTTIERWTETYNGEVKNKQSVFVEVLTTYDLIHTLTGQSVEIQGFGQGVDTQDKSAGKATTYALKNAVLYTFFVPTGSIDDTDKTHSDQAKVPPPKTVAPKVVTKKVLSKTEYEMLVEVAKGDTTKIAKFILHYELDAKQTDELNALTLKSE